MSSRKGDNLPWIRARAVGGSHPGASSSGGTGLRIAPPPAIGSDGLRQGTGGGKLRKEKVTGQTGSKYEKGVRRFEEWATSSGIRIASVEDIDLAAAEFVEHRFQVSGGKEKDAMRTLVSGIKHARPEVGRFGDKALPYTSQTLAGWAVKCPDQSRRPLPWECACAIAADLMMRGHEKFGHIIILAFDCYLRLPSEACRLRQEDIIPPPRGMDPWTVLIAPAERIVDGRREKTMEKTKTGTRDCTVIVSRTGPRRVATQSARFLREKGGQDKILSAKEERLFLAEFAYSCDRCGFQGMNFIPYQCRHGGASEDFFLWERSGGANGRNLKEVQRRGRWESDNSVKRYEKSGLLLVVLNQLPDHVRRHTSQMCAQIELLVCGSASYSEPPCASSFPMLKGSGSSLVTRKRGSPPSASAKQLAKCAKSAPSKPSVFNWSIPKR